MKVLLPIALVAVGIVVWLSWTQGRPQPLVVSGVIEAEQIRVGSRIGGRVAEVFVTEGQLVATEQPLFRIEPFDLEERLAAAAAELETLQAQLARLKAGSRPQEIDQASARRDRLAATLDRLLAGPRKEELEIARERVKSAEASLELAHAAYKRQVDLAGTGTTTTAELDRATEQKKAGESGLAAARASVALLEAGTRPEEIAEARAALAEAAAALALAQAGFRPEEIAAAEAQVHAGEARLASVQRQSEELIVRAPRECVVEAIDLHAGDLVAANAPTIALLDSTNLWVRTYVPEVRLGSLQTGMQVPVRIDGTTTPIHGTISFIASGAEFTPKNTQTPEERHQLVFRIKVQLAPGDAPLRAGMMCDVMLDEVTRQ